MFGLRSLLAFPNLSYLVCSTLGLVVKLTMSLVGVPTILLTVLGFVVGLALTFRGTSAYERFVLLSYFYSVLTLIVTLMAANCGRRCPCKAEILLAIFGSTSTKDLIMKKKIFLPSC